MYICMSVCPSVLRCELMAVRFCKTFCVYCELMTPFEKFVNKFGPVECVVSLSKQNEKSKQ